MINFIKKERYTIISFAILIIVGVLCFNEFKNYGLYNGLNEETVTDPIAMYFPLLFNLNLDYFLLLGPIFVIVPAVYQFHKELHNGYIKECLTRIEYKKYMLKHYIKALSKSFILPLFALILIFMCCVYLKSFSFGSQPEYIGYLGGIPDTLLNYNVYQFMIVYIINIFLHSIFYVNIGLLYCKKFSNFLLSVILSFITFVTLNIVFEVFIGGLFSMKVSNTLNLYNLWYQDYVISLSATLCYSLLLSVLSSILVILNYKNKEGVLIESEK